jgi:hypothetical protein
MTNTSKRAAALEAELTEKGLVIQFANGQTLLLESGMLNSDIQHAAMWHGLKQKLCDAAAISRDPDTGRAATVATKYAAVKAVYDRITGADGEAPSWNSRRDGAGAATGGLLFRALCRMYDGKKTPDELRTFLSGKSKEEQAALRKNKRVAEIIEEIKAESAKDNGADGDGLLAELGD